MIKTIVTIEMKKVNLERKAKVHFATIDENNNVELLTKKQFDKNPSEFKLPSEYLQKTTLCSLLTQIKSFRDKMEFNKFTKDNQDYLAKVNFLLEKGATWKKSGLII